MTDAGGAGEPSSAAKDGKAGDAKTDDDDAKTKTAVEVEAAPKPVAKPRRDRKVRRDSWTFSTIPSLKQALHLYCSATPTPRNLVGISTYLPFACVCGDESQILLLFMVQALDLILVHFQGVSC